ncbi:hypothetical protein CKA32_006606 [Geitlerinema sp. FC II]|nr:hypothetical protein CKA32_006606 [Geitlerinema sp. FC II]
MLGLAIAPPMNGSVAEVQTTPNSYFYKSEMHAIEKIKYKAVT